MVTASSGRKLPPHTLVLTRRTKETIHAEIPQETKGTRRNFWRPCQQLGGETTGCRSLL